VLLVIILHKLIKKLIVKYILHLSYLPSSRGTIVPLYYIVHVFLVFSKQGDNVLWVRSVLCSAHTWSIHSGELVRWLFSKHRCKRFRRMLMCMRYPSGYYLLMQFGKLSPRRRWVKCGGCIVLPQHVRHNYIILPYYTRKYLYFSKNITNYPITHVLKQNR